MKKIIVTLFLSILTMIASAQLNAGDNVYLEFQNTEGEVNVDGTDACNMLKEYIEDKSTLQIVSSKQESDFTFLLSVIEKNQGVRKGKIDIIDSKTKDVIFESKWKRGTSGFSMWTWTGEVIEASTYGFSGTRMAIGKIFKGKILRKFKEIKK